MTLFAVHSSDMPNGEQGGGRSKLATDEEAAMYAGKRVVIVEDEGIIQLQLRKSLSRLGLQVIGSALTGEEGVELCLRERPEIIFMDINMPGKIDGLEAARRILAAYRPCLVMLTAYTEFEKEAKAIGACGYIIKPVNEQILRYCLKLAYRRFQTDLDAGTL
jgi:YesN/AraC family two-component response regulator